MRTQSNPSNTFLKKRTNTEILLNPSVTQYRLNSEQKIFYTQLFNENAINGKVKRENFLPLLGIFGTKIAQDFSDRMFLVLSKGEQEITLEQYLNYIDTYHYGDIHERCLYTCKLMDTKQKGKIDLEDFQSYINLIINTVKKVNNTITKKDLMSEKDIEMLFYHISQGKTYFTYSDFENIYQEKPELVSWFDYFKNDKEDILLIIHKFMPIILKVFNDFLRNFMNDLFLLLDREKEINLDLISQKVLNYSNKLEKIMRTFTDKVSKFNITNAFNKLYDNKRKLIFDNFESNYKKKDKDKNDNIDDFFKEIKKSIYQKDQKEFILENKNINYPKYKNDDKYFAEKFLKRSDIFRNKNFKFYDEQSYLRNSNNTILKRNSLSLNNNKNDFRENLNNKINIHKSIDTFKKNTIYNNNYNNNINYNYNYNYNNNYIHNMNNINTYNNKNINLLNNNNIHNNNNIYNNNLNLNNYNVIYTIPYTNLNSYYLNDNLNNYNYINNYNYSIMDNNNIINNNYNNNYNNNINYNNNYDINTLGKASYINSNFESNICPITNFYSLKESQKLKQLLFCSRAIIEKALEINTAFNNCYKWISENYLAKTISKKVKEEKLKEKKKFRKKNTISNIPRKMVPVKKKIIGASEKSFEILFNMIMGIQIAVQAIPNFRINNKEEIKKYLTKMVYSVQTVYLGQENEESYILKEFGGVIFNNIRLYLGINKDDFIKSISPQDFITELMISSQTLFEELCSTGSSGSLLYYTRDGEFIVKTISKKEYKFLKTMISEYFFYLKNNPLSLLPKLLGSYILKRKIKKTATNIYFIVMSNVFATDNHIDLRFDLKGSIIGRKVLTGTIDDSKVFLSGDMALKDLDFNKLNERIDIGSKREIILKQISNDIEFLYSINSNDYSLLLGIHYIKDTEKEYNFSKTTTTLKTTEYKKDNYSFITEYSKDNLFSNTYDTESNISSEKSAVDRINNLKGLYDFEDGGILSENRKRIYYFGIIDILTEFNTLKHFEYCFKRLRYCSDDMSCIPPIYYKQRFYNYLNNVFSQKSTQSFEIKTNKPYVSRGYYKVDKYGAISSSRYKEFQKEEEEKYTIDDSLKKS